jgi:hypothetical protein
MIGTEEQNLEREFRETRLRQTGRFSMEQFSYVDWLDEAYVLEDAVAIRRGEAAVTRMRDAGEAFLDGDEGAIYRAFPELLARSRLGV